MHLSLLGPIWAPQPAAGFPTKTIFHLSLLRAFENLGSNHSQLMCIPVFTSQVTFIPEQAVLGDFLWEAFSQLKSTSLFAVYHNTDQMQWIKFFESHMQNIFRYWMEAVNNRSSYNKNFCPQSKWNSLTEINLLQNYSNLLSVKSNCLSEISLPSCLYGYIPLARPSFYARIIL